MKLPLEGGCLRSADYCHCHMCRRAAGAPVVARLTVADAAFAWIKGGPAVYRSSAQAERLFCPACGTQLALRDEPDCLDVTLASVDNSEAVRPNYHLDGEPDQLVEIADDL